MKKIELTLVCLLTTFITNARDMEKQDSSQINEYREYLELIVKEIDGEVLIPKCQYEEVELTQLRGKINLTEEGYICLGEEQSKLEKYRMKRYSELVGGDSADLEGFLKQWIAEDEMFFKPKPLTIEEFENQLIKLMANNKVEIGYWVEIEVFNGIAKKNVIDFLYVLEKYNIKYFANTL